MIVTYIDLGEYLVTIIFSVMVQILGMGIVPMLLYRFWVKDNVMTGFYMREKVHPAVYLLAVALGLFVHLLIMGSGSLFAILLKLLGYKYTIGSDVVFSNVGVLVLEIITGAIFPAIFEEMNYRGMGMQMLSNVKSDRKVILLTALLFGLGHQNVAQTGYAFVAGLVIGYIAVKTKSIFPGMIIHFINNALSAMISYSEQHDGALANVHEALCSIVFQNVIMVIIFTLLDVILVVLLLRYIGKLSTPKITEQIPEGQYYYPDRMQYIDDLFGFPSVPTEKKPTHKKVHYSEYAFLFATFVLMILNTLFTFVWGLWR